MPSILDCGFTFVDISNIMFSCLLKLVLKQEWTNFFLGARLFGPRNLICVPDRVRKKTGAQNQNTRLRHN